MSSIRRLNFANDNRPATVARRRDLQVFATTHSIDCLTALRRACEREEKRGDDVRVVRLVKGGRAAITFTAQELATAIEGEVEVRG